MIGLSASCCVRDIVRGEVKLEEVEKIIAGTRGDSPEAIDEIIRQYRRIEWRENPDEAERIFRHLLDAGKIEQPKLKGGRGPWIGDGWWVESEDQIRWS